MAPPTGRRDQLIRDLVREQAPLGETERYLRQYLKPDIGGLNVKQSEGILALIAIIEKMMMAFVAINNDLQPFEIGDRSLQIRFGDAIIILNQGGSITLKTGVATITMSKDGTIDLKGKDVRIGGSGEISVQASKELILKGQRIEAN